MIDRGRTILQRAPLVPRSVWTAVGIGVAFGIGIVVGDVEEAHGASNMMQSDPLAIASARSDALDKTREQLKLTYAEELQKPDRVFAAATPVPAIDKQAEAENAVEKTPAPEKAPEKAADAEQPQGDADEDDKPIERPDPALLRAAFSKVVGNESAVDASAPMTKSFALQVASVPTRAGADELAKKLNGDGHAARVVEGEVGGRAVFRVRVGGFGERAQADAYKAKLKMPSFIVTE